MSQLPKEDGDGVPTSPWHYCPGLAEPRPKDSCRASKFTFLCRKNVKRDNKSATSRKQLVVLVPDAVARWKISRLRERTFDGSGRRFGGFL